MEGEVVGGGGCSCCMGLKRGCDSLKDPSLETDALDGCMWGGCCGGNSGCRRPAAGLEDDSWVDECERVLSSGISRYCDVYKSYIDRMQNGIECKKCGEPPIHTVRVADAFQPFRL